MRDSIGSYSVSSSLHVQGNVLRKFCVPCVWLLLVRPNYFH